MSNSLILLTFLLFVFSVGAGVSVYIVRKKVSNMHGMLFTMSIAMGIGLFVGTLMGILFQDNMLLATVIGMGVGSVIGIFIGLFYSLLAVFEGLLSGIMAGMMGAMLGVMLNPLDWDRIIMIMFTIVVFICLMILFEVITYVQKANMLTNILKKPYLVGPIFFLLCYILFLQAPFFKG
ncbi:hypothetical protein ACFFF5_08235 [Lederbergia wuyishanensis]|uniref:DUF4203 domain-containing protein n=1 Tax=Lederbergia wuyishanensis TaxID=1347903 RepID=A0ABU0D6K4_9BACI|nr:hypothetical protein [Lederbergia wuyishanensis]MCJ8008591.1 hypothetical protein [Lederbergia wuyishanensis]MDQ0343993.1 hypothetical protein [Lederbergia wuyishanensis]